MTLLFGNLTQQFVDFTQVILQADNGVPGAADRIPAAAAEFRDSASKLATYLVLLGVCLDYHISTLEFNSIRYRNVLVHLLVHVCVGVYWRNQREAYPRALPSSCTPARCCLFRQCWGR